MRELNTLAAEWLREHRVTITDEALAESGVSPTQRRRMVQAGTLERVVDGTYRFCGAPVDEWSNAAALCAARDDVAVCGLSAAWYWGIRTGRKPDLRCRFITTPGARPTKAPWARFFHSASFDRADILRRSDGLKVTNPSRTVVDLARDLGRADLLLAIESALNLRLVSLATLRDAGLRAAAAGARTARRFLRTLEARYPGEPRESTWEQRVLSALVQRGVVGMVSQVRERLDGYGNVRFDLAIESLRWVVEVDVHPRHREGDGGARDRRRDRHSRWAGWQTERVGEHELLTDFALTMDELAISYHVRRREVEALKAAGAWPYGSAADDHTRT